MQRVPGIRLDAVWLAGTDLRVPEYAADRLDDDLLAVGLRDVAVGAELETAAWSGSSSTTGTETSLDFRCALRNQFFLPVLLSCSTEHIFGAVNETYLSVSIDSQIYCIAENAYVLTCGNTDALRKMKICRIPVFEGGTHGTGSERDRLDIGISQVDLQ